jgi:hypothetical protein
LLICEKGKKDVDKKDKSKRDKHRLVLCLKEENDVDNRVRNIIHRLSINHAQENVGKLLARRPCEFAACQQMKMNMENGLTGIMAIVDDHPVAALIKPSFGSDVFGNKEQVPDDFSVHYGDTVNI